MLRAMTVDVTVKNVEPAPTAVVAATATWAEFPAMWRPMLEWSRANGYQLAGPRWEIYGDPDPSDGHFDVHVFWSLVTP